MQSPPGAWGLLYLEGCSGYSAVDLIPWQEGLGWGGLYSFKFCLFPLVYSHFLLHFNPCPACLTFLRRARPFQEEVPSLTCCLGCHWAWILRFKTYWQENCRKISTSSSQSREVDGHRNGFVTGIGEVGLSSVTHMNLFWVKDLSLGRSHLYGRHGWPLDLTKSPHIFLCLMLGVPSRQYFTLHLRLEIGDNTCFYWESYGLMGNCPIKYNNGLLHRMSQGLTFCEKGYQLLEFLIGISTVLNLHLPLDGLSLLVLAPRDGAWSVLGDFFFFFLTVDNL